MLLNFDTIRSINSGLNRKLRFDEIFSNIDTTVLDTKLYHLLMSDILYRPEFSLDFFIRYDLDYFFGGLTVMIKRNNYE